MMVQGFQGLSLIHILDVYKRQDNKDPMGRENDNKSNNGRPNPNEKTKIPPLDKEQKTREILQKLKEKANDPKNTPQEQEYYDRLLKNQ